MYITALYGKYARLATAENLKLHCSQLEKVMARVVYLQWEDHNIPFHGASTNVIVYYVFPLIPDTREARDSKDQIWISSLIGGSGRDRGVSKIPPAQ